MWTKEVEELKKRKTFAGKLGGEKNIARQHANGKMTVRERINALIDKNSFKERGILTGVASYENNELKEIIPCPFIMGTAMLNSRKVAVHGDDFTVKGASVGKLYKKKGAYFVKMARSLKLPIVRLIEGAGGSIREILENGYTELPSSGDECVQNRVEVMSEVPVVSAGFGSVAGLGALFMVQSHFSVMVKEKAHVFVGGPPLVKAASLGDNVTKEELGGYKLHTRLTGVIDNAADDEEDALNQVKRFLSYLPSNVWEMPQRDTSTNDPQDRREEDLLKAIPKNVKRAYNMRKILKMVLDKGSIFEIGRYQGRSQITALARINGYPVGILANDPGFIGGSFNYDVAEKFQRFIDMCDTFHLPIVNFVDQPGFTIGKKSEIQGTIRKGVRASFAMVQATTPLAIMYIRKCFGVAGAAQKGGNRLSWRYAWPSAVFGNIPVEGGVYAAHRVEIESSEDPKACLEALHDRYREVTSPFKTAEFFGLEDIIDPRDTRPLLCDWVEMAYEVERHNLGPKKRGMRC